MIGQRRKILSIPERYLIPLMRGDMVIDNIAKETVMHHAEYDPYRRGLLLHLENENYPVVPDDTCPLFVVAEFRDVPITLFRQLHGGNDEKTNS